MSNETHTIRVPGSDERVNVTPLVHPAVMEQKRLGLIEQILRDGRLRLACWLRVMLLGEVDPAFGTEIATDLTAGQPA